MSKFKMVDPMVSPRFCNTGDYMRLPRVKDPADMDAFDFVIFGVPFDTAGCYRIGARFGPSAIRSISTILKPYNAALDVDIWEQLAGCDYGDVDAIPGFLEDTYFNTERDLDAILKKQCGTDRPGRRPFHHPGRTALHRQKTWPRSPGTVRRPHRYPRPFILGISTAMARHSAAPWKKG